MSDNISEHGLDLSKLPKWAQAEIRRLEMRLREAQQEIDERDDKIGRTDTVIGMTRLEQRPLPRGSKIGFFLYPDREELAITDLTVARSEDLGEGVVEVYGRGPIRVEPRSSNVVWIRLARDER